MTAPFAHHDRRGITWVDARADEAFRKALLAGVPSNLLPKMQEALNATPDAGARAHSIRYFGDELEAIMQQVNPLMMVLSETLANTYNLPGLLDWLNVTNYGNDYRMIKAFKAWSEMRLADKSGVMI